MRVDIINKDNGILQQNKRIKIMEQQYVPEANQVPLEEVKQKPDTLAFQNKQIEARLYVLKPQDQKKQKGVSAINIVGQQKKTSESDYKQKLLKQHRGGVINKQSSGDTDAMNGVGVEDLALEDATGSSIESEQWNLMAVGGSKGIFKGPAIQNVINVDFTDSQGSDIQLRLSGNNPNMQVKSHGQDLVSSIDSTPNNDQNDIHYSMQSKSPQPHTQLIMQTHIEQSELIPVQQNRHNTIVQLDYSPQQDQNRILNKNQQNEPEILSHGILPHSQLSTNAQRLHQYSKLIHKSSIGGTKFAILNSQLKVNPDSISAPATTSIVSSQEISSKPSLLSNKKNSGITSSLITKSSIVSTSSMRKMHASPNQSSNMHHINSKQAKTAVKSHNTESEYQVTTTPFAYHGPSSQGAQSFHQSSVPKSSQMSITPGQVVQKSSFLANNNPKQNSNPSIAGGGKLSPRMPQTNSGSYSILARQRSQNKLQASASQPQMTLQQPMIIQSHQLTGFNIQSDDSSKSGGNSNNYIYPTTDLLQVEKQWKDQVQPLLDQWGINFQVKNAYTKQEVSELVFSLDKEVIKPFIARISQEKSRSSQFQAQSQILEAQLQQQLQQQKAIQDSILQVRSQFSKHEEILKKMEECKNELKQVNLNTLMCLDFFRDLEGYIGEQRYKKESRQDVIQTLNEIEGIMQQHSLYSIEFDTERIQNLAESIQEYVRARQMDKKVININIGDEFDEKKYTSNTSGDNFIFSPSGQYAPSLDDSMQKGSLQVKITRVANHASSKLQQAKLINLSQEKDLNRSYSNQNRHLNGGCCSSHSKDFNVSLKQTTALDELKVKTAMINRLRDQLEYKLKKILALKEELRVEREDTLKTASIKKIQESLIKMEHDYNVSVIRNTKLSLELREIKGQYEEMQKEAGKMKNYMRETTKMNQELKKVVEERSGFQSLEETVAQLSCMMVSKRNEILTSEQRDQIRYIFGSSIVIQRLKHKIHQQEDQIEKFSSYLLQSLKLNHQYKDQFSFLWPLLRLVYQQPDLDVIKLKFEQIWRTQQQMDDYQYREIDTRADYLRQLKKEIENDNIIMSRSAHLADNFSNDMTPGLARAKALVSSSIILDDRDSQIWQGLKSLKKEYSNKIVTTTAAKSKKLQQDQSQNDFHFNKDTKLLNTQEPDGKKRKSVFLHEENLNQELEDSLLLNDDIGAFNELLSPFVDDQLHKKFEFGEIGSDPIRSSAQANPAFQVIEQFQNIAKTTKQDQNPEDSLKHNPLPSTTPEILINQDFTYYAHQEQNKLNSTAEDLKIYSVIQGLGSHEDDISTYFKQGLKQAPKTSKKMLKEKVRALKQKNTDLVVAIKEMQERVRFLEEQTLARERTVSSDSRDDRQSDMKTNDPLVFKDEEIRKQFKSPIETQKKLKSKDHAQRGKDVSIQYQYEEQSLPNQNFVPKEGTSDENSNCDVDRLDLINMISMQAEALENIILQRKSTILQEQQ